MTTSITREQRHQMAVRQWALMTNESLPKGEGVELSKMPENVQEAFAKSMIDPLLAAADIVIEEVDDAPERAELLELAAHVLAVADREEGSLCSRMTATFSWMSALSKEDRKKCSADVVAAARASFTDSPHLALAELTSWRETATAMAQGLHKVPTVFFEDEETHKKSKGKKVKK